MNLNIFQGTLVNGAAIILGALVGVVIGKLIPERFNDITMQGIGLAILLIGLQMALKSGQMLLLIISLIVGGLLGEWLKLEERLNIAGKWLEKWFGHGRSPLAQAFVYATLIYVVGAMAITGALESGLLGRHQILYTKSLLDGVTAVVFASTMGIGVAFSALPVIIYQGGLAFLAGWLSQFLIDPVITELTATGGLLITGIGINILQLRVIKVGNLLPALAVNFLLVFWWGGT